MMISADEFGARLAARLAQPLPGMHSVQNRAPELSYGRHAGPAALNRRDAAVLILFYRGHDQWQIPLMLRPHHMSDHAGQIGFPGGLIEPNETVEACAVREFIEELAPSSSNVQLLGRLSSIFIYGSNFQVTPMVAICDESLAFEPQADEVAELLEFPLTDLLNAKNEWHWRERSGVKYKAPHLSFREHRIWGATRLMLAELELVLRDIFADSSRDG